MRVLLLSAYLGAVVSCVLKLGSPHRNLFSWVIAGLVGAFGAVVGLFVARIFGFSREEHRMTIGVAVAASAALTLLYAAASRALYSAQRKKGRETRPTIVF